MGSLVADYDQEKKLLRQLVERETSKHLLFLQGGSGLGKTTLLIEFIRAIPANVACVPIQLRELAIGPTEILDRVGILVGWDCFPNFTKQVSSLVGGITVNISRNWQLGSNNLIQVALQSADYQERQWRRAMLTDAWIADMERFPQLLLLVLDTYERATNDMLQWFEGPFLTRAAQASNLRIVVAGRQVPDSNNIEWGQHCLLCTLRGVHEPQCWLPIVDVMNRRIDAEHPLSWLKAVCQLLEGKPKDIMQFIENLPLRETV